MDDRQKTNLLIEDSFSGSDDVPDLELVPPTTSKAKRKKFKLRKLNGPRFPSVGFNSGGESGEATLPRCYSLSITFLLFSLVLGLSVLAWFAINLHKDALALRAEFDAFRADTAKKLKSQGGSDPKKESVSISDDSSSSEIQRLETLIESVETKLKYCCDNQPKPSSTPDPSALSSPTPDLISRVNAMRDSINDLNATLHKILLNSTTTTASIDTGTESLKQELQKRISDENLIVLEKIRNLTEAVRIQNTVLQDLEQYMPCLENVCAATSSTTSQSRAVVATVPPPSTKASALQPSNNQSEHNNSVAASTLYSGSDPPDSNPDSESESAAGTEERKTSTDGPKIRKRPGASEKTPPKEGKP